MTRLLASLLLSICTLTWCTGYSQISEPIAGDSMQSLAGLKLDSWQEHIGIPLRLIKLSSGKGTYEVPEGEWDGIQMRKVRVVFYNRKLLSITLIVEGEGNSHELLERLQQKWGPGQQYGYAPRYTWHSKYSIAEYDENLISHTATIELLSLTQQRAWERQFTRQLED